MELQLDNCTVLQDNEDGQVYSLAIMRECARKAQNIFPIILRDSNISRCLCNNGGAYTFHVRVEDKEWKLSRAY